MANIFVCKTGERPYEEHVEVSSLVQLGAIDRDAANRMTDRLLTGAESLRSKGPLSVDTDHNAARGELRVSLVGTLSAVNRLLNYKSEADQRIFEERAQVSTVVRIDPIDRPFSISLTDHLSAAAHHHPQNDVPLRIDTTYDEAGMRLELVLTGSVFAISYLLMILYLRLTQRLNRVASHV
jgi:hypothetical protein